MLRLVLVGCVVVAVGISILAFLSPNLAIASSAAIAASPLAVVAAAARYRVESAANTQPGNREGIEERTLELQGEVGETADLLDSGSLDLVGGLIRGVRVEEAVEAA